jgi:hypothetical protein
MIDSAQQSKASLFPCDCGTEGIVIVAEMEDEREIEGAPFISMAFFGIGPYSDNRLPLHARLRWIWQMIRTGNPFEDMVTLRSNVAKNMANHILYLLSRNKTTKPELDYLVKLPEKTPDELPITWGKLMPPDLGLISGYIDPMYSNGIGE